MTLPAARVRLAALLAAALLAPLTAMIGAAPAARAATAPSRPGPLSVSSVAQDHAEVSFGRSRASSAVRYRVLANGRTVLTTRHYLRVRVPLACGRTYRLVAVAVDSQGRRSQASPAANLRTRACLDTTAPTAPSDLEVTGVDAESVSLAWPAATDRVGVTGYLVYRDGVVLGGSSTRTYTARNLRADRTYSFAVKARDRAGNLSAPVRVTATTERPVQASGDVRAYVLTSDDQSFADARAHYQQLESVYPTFFSVTAAGDVSGTGSRTLSTWFQDRGVHVLPRFHTEDPAAIEALVTDPSRRDWGARQIAAVVAAGGYDGANLDLEMNMPATGTATLTQAQRWDRLRSGYSDFVDAVAAALHAEGRLLSVAVSPNWCSRTDPQTRQTVYCTSSASTSTRRPRAYLFDYRRIARSADELWVMAWGLHWSTSESGAVADQRWLGAVTAYYADLFADQPTMASRLTLGTNLYGMDWSEYVVRTDRLAWPGTAFPAAPTCPDSKRAARARTHYEGTPGAGTLVVEWTCLTRYAETHEFSAIDPADFTGGGYDADSAEHVLTAPDAAYPGAQRVLWYVDRRTIEARSSIARSAGWHVGLWRLGREDQSIWTLPTITAGAPS